MSTVISTTVRYYAAAAAAAGSTSEAVNMPADASVRDLADHLGAARPELARVLARCSYLRDGVAVRDPSAPLAPATVVDVLPPFAGG